MATFKLIRQDKESLEPDLDKWFLWSIPITIALCGIAVWLDLLGMLLLLWGLALLLQVLGIPRKLLQDWPRQRDVIGELHVNEHGLVQTKEREQDPLLFMDIRSAVLEHNHIQGEPLGPRDIAHNGIATLRMTLKNGQERTIKFLIERKDQVPDVEVFLRALYINSISLKEYAGRLRLKTILFKHGRSYAEVQDLKKSWVWMGSIELFEQLNSDGAYPERGGKLEGGNRLPLIALPMA